MIDLVFPLSLPLTANDPEGEDRLRHQQALAAVRAALTRAGLQRSRALHSGKAGDRPQSPAPGVAALAHEQWLQQRLACADPDEANVLALRAQAQGLAAAGPGRQAWLLRPVHLHLGLDHVVLAGGESDTLVLDQPQAWIETLSEALEPGWALGVWSGPRGETFLRLETPAALDWQPRSALHAAGRSIELYLPQGRDARRWRRFLNHTQMLMHEHPLNEQRGAAGQRPVNGLWLEGRIKDHPGLSVQRLQREELAQVLSRPAAVAGTAPDLPQLMIFEDWITPARLGDEQAWNALWQDFPRFATALRETLAGRAGSPQDLNWHFFGEARSLSLRSDTGDAWKFWRRPLARLS